MRKYFIFLMILYVNSAFSQLNDSFADGNFNASPPWGGDVSAFTVSSNKLQTVSNASAQTFSLSTANTAGINTKWEFYIQLNFDPSANNQARIYLISDIENLKNPLNGYFIQIGETGTTDSYDLYRQNGAGITRIIDGPSKTRVNANQLIARVQVTRTSGGIWEIKTDITGGTNFISEGTVTDNTFISTAWFGVYCKYTTTNSDKFIFDDFKIEPLVTDIIPPKLLSATVIDSLTIDVLFDEPMDSISAKNTINYFLNNGYANPVLVSSTPDAARYRLKFPVGFNTGTYVLTADNVKDRNNNPISGNNTVAFSYVKPYIAAKKDVVINEIFADPAPQIDLPSVEFIELLNTTSHTIYLQNWKYGDASTSVSFLSDSIKAGQLLILCAKADTNEFKDFGKVIGISPWPSLNNTGDVLKLISPENKVIDSVAYSDAWHRDSGKRQGGWTLERIDPRAICQGFFNWNTSTDISGGTPGKKNSIYYADYDQLVLKADSLRQLSDSTIRVFFNKHVDASTVKTDKFILNPLAGSLLAIGFDTEYREATIRYSGKFSPNTVYILNISAISDCSGKGIATASQLLTFQTPALSPTPPPPPVRLDTATIYITEIFADPSPEVGLPLAEFIEIYNPGKDTIDLEGWTYGDSGTKSAIKKSKILPKEYLILCPSADTVQYKTFGKTIGISPWPSLNNASDQIVLKSFKGRTVDLISYSDTWYKNLIKKQGGWTLERIDAKSICQGLFNWSSSIDSAGGTPGKQNSVYQANYDRLSLKADSLKQLSDSILKIFFNKPLDASTLDISKLILTPASANIISSGFDTEYKQLILTFNQKFISNTTYTLNISGISDCSGNIIPDSQLAFQTPAVLPAPPPPPVRLDTATIYITEIFADPSPEVGLPLSEFVEIYNPGKDTIDLDGWTFNDPGTKAPIKKGTILPKEYLILCPVADTVQYKTFGKTIGISPWPSLNNSSDQIILKSFKSRTVDSISYSDSWYKDVAKKSGGWTLERIDPESVCQGLYNWGASINNKGGTPGSQNSIHRANYDQLPLRADSLNQLSDSTLKIFFNKPLDASTLDISKLILTPASDSIISSGFDTEYKQLILIYNQKFISNTAYTLNISGISDCSGNIISPSPLTFQTPPLPPAAAPPPIRSDTAKLYITEIFADPSPEVGLPLAEFVEIYNPGKDTIDLDGWTLNDSGTKGVIRKGMILPKEHLILCPVADTVQYKAFGKTIGISLWPSLSNTSDQIILKSFTGRTVDSVAYSDNWYKNPVKKSGGWTLERIDPESVCQGLFNWVASINNKGGTPGSQNSIYQANYDKSPLRADSLTQLSESVIKIFFNKSVDATTLDTAKLVLSPASANISSSGFDTEYGQLTLTYNLNFIPNTIYALDISAIADCSGNIISPSPLTFQTPPLPPAASPPPIRSDTAKLYITEIFADPSPEVGLPLAEFVEIYNPGKDTIDLDGWTFNDSGTKATIKKGVILPKEYLILCPTADTVHYKPFGKVAGLSSWPLLNNASDQIVLRSFKNRMVDSIAYSDDWYKDPVKKPGGWTLERIDPESVCQGLYNWGASINNKGGTPGSQNSIHRANYDQLPLRADSLKQLSDSTLKVFFNKPLDISTVDYGKFNLTPVVAAHATISFNEECREAVLLYKDKFSPDIFYTLTIKDILDCSGNTIETINQPLFFHVPALPPAPKPLPERLDTGRIRITEVFADPSPEVGLPLVEFVEIYNPGKDTIDLDGWIFKDTGTKAIIRKVKILPKEYMVLCPVADTIHYQSFGKTAGLSPWPSLNNASDQIVLKSFKSRVVDSISYSDNWYKNPVKKSGGWSLERIEINDVYDGFYFWNSSENSLGGTPGEENSIKQTGSNKLTLKIDTLHLISDSTLQVILNTTPDTSFIKASYFDLGIAGKAEKVELGSNYRSINLEFKSSFDFDKLYTLTVDSLRTYSGVLIDPVANKKSFLKPGIPEMNYNVIINEIFTDYSPGIGLPEAEFIELYNPTDMVIDIRGMIYEDSGVTKYTFTKGQIGPKGYLIVCPEKDTLSYKPFGKVLGISPWPSLNNDKDVLILRNNKGKEIHRVSYNNLWYKNKDKQQGGWTLELIDPQTVCSGSQNWMASKDASGGTPGKQNSVYKIYSTNDPLKLINAVLVDSITLKLGFNRPLDSLSATINHNFTLNNGVGNPVAVLPLGPDFEQIILKFSSAIARGNTYRVTVSNIMDCSGITISTSANSTEFMHPEKIDRNDILINEVLFNPHPNGVDFVEIYNKSDKILDLKDLSLATTNEKDSTVNLKQLSSDQLLMLPHHYLVLTTDPNKIKKEYPVKDSNAFLRLTSFPVFNNDAGVVVLVSNNIRIDQLNYSEKAHFALIKNPEGVSLERSNFNRPANESGNFRSAAASAGYATPGYRNSQYTEGNISGAQEVTLISKTFSPDNDGFEDILTLDYNFSKPGMIANASVFNSQGMLIKRLSKNQTLSASGAITWDGLNEYNERSPVGIYMIYLEVFNLDGAVKKYRKNCVLAAKLN